MRVLCPKSGARVLGTTPHYNHRWSTTSTSGLQRLQLVYWCLLHSFHFPGGSSFIHFGGLTRMAIMEAFTRNYTSYGQVARVIVRMGCIQVKLENIVSHVILL